MAPKKFHSTRDHKWSLKRIVAASGAAALCAGAAFGSVGAAPAQAAVLDNLGRPNEQILGTLENFANQQSTPENIRSQILSAVDFFRGTGEGGVELPSTGTAFVQFAWPSVSTHCVDHEYTATGMAMAVPGPADLPLPGVEPGQVTFVFTALGTGTYSEEQFSEMNVHWFNIQNRKSGNTRLSFNGINPEGPATVSGTADTGSGTVLAWLDGGFSNNASDGTVTTCNFVPTGAVINVA
ncbi:MAG: hypothetical protein Q3962_00235 [Corynebacterium sp.]|nr:hypothetical protein [Corynebacterium sp.]